MKTLFILLAVLALLFSLLFVYALCVVSGRQSRLEEEHARRVRHNL